MNLTSVLRIAPNNDGNYLAPVLRFLFCLMVRDGTFQFFHNCFHIQIASSYAASFSAPSFARVTFGAPTLRAFDKS